MQEGGSLHSEYSESSPAVFSYCEAFTLHSSPVSASLPDWKVIQSAAVCMLHASVVL